MLFAHLFVYFSSHLFRNPNSDWSPDFPPPTLSSSSPNVDTVITISSPHVTPHVDPDLLDGSRNTWPPRLCGHPHASLVPSHPPCMPGSETGAPSPRLVGRFVLVAMRPCIHHRHSHHHPDTRTPVSTLGVGLGHNGMLFFFCFGLCALMVRMAAMRRTVTCCIPSAAASTAA